MENEQKLMKRVTVSDKGETKISMVPVSGIAMPGATRERKVEGATYAFFNTMVVGDSYAFPNKQAATAAKAAFDGSDVYEKARQTGRLVTRSLKKYPEIRAAFEAKQGVTLTEEAYGVWMDVPKPPKAD